MKQILIKYLLCLIFIPSVSYSSCKQLDEEQVEGLFKILSVTDLKIDCVVKYEITVATEMAKVKVPGCKVDLQLDKEPLRRFSVMMAGNDCKIRKGASINRTLSTNRNTCCAISSMYGGIGPKCSRSEDGMKVKLTEDINDDQKMCVANIQWQVIEK